MAGANMDLDIGKIREIAKAAIDVAFPANDAYAFLVDTINNAGTLQMLRPMIKSVPSGNIDALTISRRKIRLADDDNGTATGVKSITKRQIPYAVKKVFWDEWIKNDDVFYNAIRAANNVATQAGITNATDLETLIIQMLQKQFAMDLQDLIFNGDTASTGQSDSDFLKIMDGFVKKMKVSANAVDLTTNALTLGDFNKVVQSMPEEFKNNFGDNMKWFMTRTQHDVVAALIQARATAYGDAVLKDGKILRIAGYGVEVVSGMAGGAIFLTPVENLVPIFTQTVKYKRVGEGAEAAKRDSTYHIIHAYMDCVIREIKAVAYMKGTKI